MALLRPRDLPNAITVTRFVVTALCIALLEVADPDAPATGPWAGLAFAAFLVAALTDWVDGWLARKLDCVSRFGRIVDPLVDKVLILGALVVALRFEQVRAVLPAWIVVVLVSREVVVTTLRGVAEGEGHEFPADRVGKWKMVVQSVLAAGLLAELAWPDAIPGVAPALPALVGLALLLTLWSGIGYVVRATSLLARSPAEEAE
jgi:CDP-diacylglycerol--glycerol-3-phosphate 3-phosphatidyltransferase